MVCTQDTARRGPGAAPPDGDRPAAGDDGELPALVAAAVAGEAGAWDGLMRRFSGMVTAVARSCRLNDADVGDVHQLTWLRLVEHIDRIEQPERVGAWLATTARRESLRVVRAKARVSFDYDGLLQRADPEAAPLDAGPLAEERSEAVQRAFAKLPPHCRRLLGVLAGNDPPSYKEISKALSMPIGSIGPTRGRCLEHLRRIMQEQGADV
jgi:RNA polymerase sigma factor (sigma-70 family)